MIPVQQFVEEIIQPALVAIELYTPEAEQLLLGTALQESMLTYTRQLGDGPARGYFQMEPATHDDIWLNFLKYKRNLAQRVINVLGNEPNSDYLETHHLYAAAMCRVHYYRARGRIPPYGDIVGHANFWKQYYNTYLGAGKPEEYLHKWEKYVGAY